MSHMIVENKHTHQRCYHIKTEERRVRLHFLQDVKTDETMQLEDEMFRKHWRWVDDTAKRI
ncbi:MAG: hypothetical protein KAS32_14580 [Candidatus Peribacteraceae bacterium]|nr:hypothetical protein [Candidatus Peribacteraceae bacterium]